MSFDLGEVQITFPVGTTVVVADSTVNAQFGPLQTYGMRGCVRMIDAKAGVCVSLFISRLFQPCFWYQPSCLRINTELVGFLPVPADALEKAMGGSRTRPLNDAAITTGVLRSWLIDRAQARTGQVIYNFIAKMNYKDLTYLYQEEGYSRLLLWLKENDTRVKRPQMMSTQDANTIDITSNSQFRGAIQAKRPKMG